MYHCTLFFWIISVHKNCCLKERLAEMETAHWTAKDGRCYSRCIEVDDDGYPCCMWDEAVEECKGNCTPTSEPYAWLGNDEGMQVFKKTKKKVREWSKLDLSFLEQVDTEEWIKDWIIKSSRERCNG